MPTTCAEENSEAFAGHHNKNSTSFFLFDESSLNTRQDLGMADAGLTDGEPMWFAFGNPTRNIGAFYEATFENQAHRWHARSIDSRTGKFQITGCMTRGFRITAWILTTSGPAFWACRRKLLSFN